MNITDALKEEIGSYELTEWSGKIGSSDFDLYAKPVTPTDMERVTNKFPNFGSTTMEPSGMALLICIKSYDGDGKKVFSLGKDYPLVKRLDTNKIGEIFKGLFGDHFDDYDENEFDDLKKGSVKVETS